VARSDERPLRLRTLGPAGIWRLRSVRGATVGDSSGMVGDTLTVTPSGADEDWRVELVWSGAAGDTTFAFEHFEPAQRWDVRAVAWDSLADPRSSPELPADLLARPAAFAATLPRLDWMWYRPDVKALPLERWAMRAESDVLLPEGGAVLRTISDDAIRVWMDGHLVIDHWSPHESAVDETSLPGGRHRLRVDYLQVDGWTELRLEFARR
jgi:hypothetical protein